MVGSLCDRIICKIRCLYFELTNKFICDLDMLDG